MFRSKDLYNRNIYDSCGKELGKIKDIVLDFISNKVSGFLIFNSNEETGIKRLGIDEIIEGDRSYCREDRLEDLFSDIKTMDVIDSSGDERGIVNDFILDEESFEIKAFVIEKEELNGEANQREVVLSKDIVLSNGFIYYIGNKNFVLKDINKKI